VSRGEREAGDAERVTCVRVRGSELDRGCPKRSEVWNWGEEMA